MKIANLPRRRHRNSIVVAERLETRQLLTGASNFLVAVPDPKYSGVTDIATYTQSGSLLSLLPTAANDYGADGGPRDFVVDPAGNLQIFEGTFSPKLVTIGPGGTTTTHDGPAGWSVVNRTFYGGIAATQNYVFVVDMLTGSDSPGERGLIRFDVNNGYAPLRFAQDADFCDVTLGLDGNIYALVSPPGQPLAGSIREYNPTTLALIKEVPAPATDDASVVADAQGNMYVGTFSSGTFKLNPQGTVIGSSPDDATDLAIRSDGTIIGSGNGRVTFYDQNLTELSHVDNLSGFIAWASFQGLPTPGVSLNASNPAPHVGDSVTFTASVTPAGAAAVPTGNVIFFSNGASIGSAALNASGVATLTTSSLPAGADAVTVNYAGDGNYASASSSAVSETVSPATGTLAVIVSLQSSDVAPDSGDVVTFTATVAPAGNGATPTGTAAFLSNGAQIGFAALNSAGVATLTISSLETGLDSITADYSGDATYKSTVSSSVSETVLQVSSGNFLAVIPDPSNNNVQDIATYSQAGTLLTVTPLATNDFGADGGPRDFVVDPSGNLQVFEGTFSPELVTIGAAGATVHDGPAGWSVVNRTFYGGIAAVGNYVFAVDMKTGSDSGGEQGLIRFDASNSYAPTRFAEGTDYCDVSLGLDGNIYALQSPPGQPSAGVIDVFNPITLALIKSVPAPASDDATVVADAQGNMYVGTFGSGLFKLDPQGNVIATSPNDATSLAIRSDGAILGSAGSRVSFYDQDLNETAHVDNLSGFVAWAAYQGPPAIAAVSASKLSVSAGAPVTLTATVAAVAGSATPTGAVTFLSNGAPIGTTALGVNGVATLSTSSLAVGNNAITVDYVGDGTFSPTSSSAVSEVVTALPVNVSLISSDIAPSGGDSVLLTATVTPQSGSTEPTGTVVFYSNGAAIGSGSLDSNGVATLATTQLTVGIDSVTASYGGDTTFAATASAAISETVKAIVGAPTVTLMSSDLAPDSSDTVTLTVTVAPTTGAAAIPTGTVSFYSNNNVIGSVTLDGNGVGTLVVSPLPVGADAITATYSGDTTFPSASTANPLTETVTLAIGTPAIVSLDASTLAANRGRIVTLTANVAAPSGGAAIPTGSVNFFSDGTQIGSANLDAAGIAMFATGSLISGMDTITASYVGDSEYGSALSASIAVTVAAPVAGAPTPGVTLVSSNIAPNSSEAVTFTASVLAVAGGSTPTGSVVFLDNDGQIGLVALDSNGVAALTVSFPTGANAITATYSGDNAYDTAVSSTVSESVTPASAINGAFVGTLPAAAVIAGQKANIHQTLSLANTGAVPGGKPSIELFLAAGDTIDSNAVQLPAPISKNLTLRAGSHAKLPIMLRSLPSTIPAGMYHLVALITDAAGNTMVAASSGVLSVAPPEVDLAGRFLKTPVSAKPGAHVHASILVANNGNVAVNSPIQIVVYTSTDSTLDANAVQASPSTTRINLQSGKRMQISLGSIQLPSSAGSYYLIVQLDPQDTLGDVNEANNVFATVNPIIAGRG